MNYRERILALAGPHGIDVQEDLSRVEDAAGNVGLGVVKSAPIECELTFMVALHELGHLMTAERFMERKVEWAKQNPDVMLGVMAAHALGQQFHAHDILPLDLHLDEEAAATEWALEQHPYPSPGVAKRMLEALRSHNDYDRAGDGTPDYRRIRARLRALSHQ